MLTPAAAQNRGEEGSGAQGRHEAGGPPSKQGVGEDNEEEEQGHKMYLNAQVKKVFVKSAHNHAKQT